MRNWNMSLEPRKYQRDALEHALGRQRSVCCLPTGTGKTLVGALWLQNLMESSTIRRALILEPTRLLVKQVALYYMDKGGIEVQSIDGSIPPEHRKSLWQEPVVVATPESAYNDRHWLDFDAVLVDECHHTVGKDAFAKLMDVMDSPYRLGLSATVPQKRRPEIESYIGRIRQWNWSDPEIERYMPDWIGEVYEAELDESESQALELIRSLPSRGFGTGLLERFLTRDGTLALVETLSRHGKLANEFGGLILPVIQGEPKRLHKLTSLQQLLDDHDFSKAIIFVERRVLAMHLAETFRGLNPALLLGRSKIGQQEALEQAKSAETRLIIATSAGEEGIDLPEADLLVAWGNVASEIRFIQRHGRIMRGNQFKFATFIVTPATSDFDSFVKGIERAQESGQINIEEAFGWEPSILWPKTTWWQVTESLRGQGRPLRAIGEVLGIRDQMVSRVIQGAVKRGRIFYIYDVFRIATDIAGEYLTYYAQFPDTKPVSARLRAIANESREIRSPLALSRSLASLLVSCPPEIVDSLTRRLTNKLSKFSIKAKGILPTLADDTGSFVGDAKKAEKISQQRIYLLSEDAGRIAEFLPDQVAPYEQFSENPAAYTVSPMRQAKSGRIDKRPDLSSYRDSIKANPRQFWETSIQRGWDDNTPGYTLGSKSIALEYYFFPGTPEVFATTVANMCGFLKWRDILIASLNKCSHCGGQGAWKCPHCSGKLCLNCWKAEAIHGGICWQLVEYGPPVTK